MQSLALHEFHQRLGARFGGVNGAEVVTDYGAGRAEHAALRRSAGVLDFSFRSRICLIGADRVRFLHGQVTNDVKRLRAGEGCYAAIVTTKGKMESDAAIFNLPDELLLDFEPGLAGNILRRLGRFIVADDVQIVDVAPHCGLLSVQGPMAERVIRGLNLFSEIPTTPFGSVKIADTAPGDIYLMNHSRLGLRRHAAALESADMSAQFKLSDGFDLFVPMPSLVAIADKLVAAAKDAGGCACGWTAFETARIEAGIPRFGADMTEANLPLECGIEGRAISYNKGCYIGQEVLNRIHSFGHVAKELCGLRLGGDLHQLPARGDRLFQAGKEAGGVTSAVKSPALNANIALGYVRREANQVGAEFTVRTAAGEIPAKIAPLPFVT